MEKNLEVTNDFIFKTIFGKKGNEDILKGLLEAILEISIQDVEIIENTKLEVELPKQKLGILDIRAKLQDNTKINIEMQVVNKKDILERTLFYWSKLYILGAEKGDEYINMPKTITINILNYNFLPNDEYCLSAHLYYDKHKEHRITDELEMHFIDLVKFRKLVKSVNSRLVAWLSFIARGNKEMVDEAKEYEEAIEKAEKILNDLKENEEAMEIYELTQKKIKDEASARWTGREEGKKEQSEKIAKKLIKQGLELKEISDITELTEEELKKL